MVPAMDRSKKSLTRPSFIGVVLAIASSNLGCSQLKSHLWGESRPSAELGQAMDTQDIYARGHRPKPSTLSAAPIPSGVESSPPNSTPAEVDEMGAAIRPVESPDDHSVTGVSLEPPTSIDARGRSKAKEGVPDGARILASAELRHDPKAETTPREVVAAARAALDAMTNYQVSMHRQERVNGSLLPEEDVVLAIRREPRAVRLTWIDGPNRGREVLYRADDPSGQMQIKMANPVLPRVSLSPDSPMVMRNSRHPVTEAGFDSLVEGLENALKAESEVGIMYSVVDSTAGLDGPHRCLIRNAPSGEVWKVYLDPKTHLPLLVLEVDSRGDLLERYIFKDVRANLPELASVDAFDANARWGQPRGLFGRLANGSPDGPPASPR